MKASSYVAHFIKFIVNEILNSSQIMEIIDIHTCNFFSIIFGAFIKRNAQVVAKESLVEFHNAVPLIAGRPKYCNFAQGR